MAAFNLRLFFPVVFFCSAKGLRVSGVLVKTVEVLGYAPAIPGHHHFGTSLPSRCSPMIPSRVKPRPHLDGQGAREGRARIEGHP